MNQATVDRAKIQRFLVGGAVRDALLGIAVKDRDWLVIGQTPESMFAAGFRPVGNDFPVFIDPETGEEHALARTERKSGKGHRGFTFHTGEDVTIEEDLARRDLTINAIAQSEDGKLIDPWGGLNDLHARMLRHTSEAFAEDPLRVLRVARFAAKYAPMGFSIHESTMDLMCRLVSSGEVDTLTAERVWKETEKALLTERPSVYFKVLHACGALQRVMPELAALSGVPQSAEHHPEIDTLIHVLMCVDVAAREGLALEVRIAALLHDLGKGVTPKDEWPRHRQHETRGVPLVERFCDRLRVPTAVKELSKAVSRDHLNVHRLYELRPGTVLDLLERLGAFRHPDRFEWAVQACQCDARGRLGMEGRAYPQGNDLRVAARLAREVPVAAVLAAGFDGAEIGKELGRRRQACLSAWKSAVKARLTQP